MRLRGSWADALFLTLLSIISQCSSQMTRGSVKRGRHSNKMRSCDILKTYLIPDSINFADVDCCFSSLLTDEQHGCEVAERS